MAYNGKLIAGGLGEWGKYMRELSLPEWDALPGFELYMDQVIAILSQHLSFLPTEKTGDKVITSSAINNYVRMKIMPAPNKKKYSRKHIAYLLMICMLKQSMSISSVQKMIPAELSEEQVKAIYNSYVAQMDKMTRYFVENSQKVAEDILGPGDDSTTYENSVRDLVIASALLSTLSKLLTENLVKLQDTASKGEEDEEKTEKQQQKG